MSVDLEGMLLASYTATLNVCSVKDVQESEDAGHERRDAGEDQDDSAKAPAGSPIYVLLASHHQERELFVRGHVVVTIVGRRRSGRRFTASQLSCSDLEGTGGGVEGEGQTQAVLGDVVWYEGVEECVFCLPKTGLSVMMQQSPRFLGLRNPSTLAPARRQLLSQG